MSINGEYIFYEDGKEVYRSKNVITKFGKRFLTSAISGALAFQTKSIAIGIGGQSESESDTRLQFEFYKAPVQIGSADIVTDPLTGLSEYGVIFKTTLPNDVSGVIKEIGLYPSQAASFTDYSDKYISSFESNSLWIDSEGNNPALVASPTPLIGEYLFKIDAPEVLSPNTYSTKEYYLNTSFDISGYSVNDSLSLAFNQEDANLDYIYVRFCSSNTDYYEARFDGDSDITDSNKIVNKLMLDVFSGSHVSGSPNPSSITKIVVGAKSKTAAGTIVYLDGLRINDEDSFDPIYGLISRSTLNTPITKKIGRQLDIEYRIGLNF